MAEERDKNTRGKIRKYFRENFFVDRSSLFDPFREDDVDPTYNFEFGNEEEAPKSIFETINEALMKRKDEKAERFLRKLEIMAEAGNEDRDNIWERTEKYDFEEYENEQKSLFDIKKTVSAINNENPYEFYDTINSDGNMPDKMLVTKIEGYDTFSKKYEKEKQEIKNREILGLQKFYSDGSRIFNKAFFDEFVKDVLKYGAKNTLKAYMHPIAKIPKKILFGEGSVNDLTDTVYRIKQDDRLRDFVDGKKDFETEYGSIKKIIKKEFNNTNFDKINEIGRAGKNFKIGTLDGYVEVLNFNGNDYLKEYKELKPYLDRYNIRRMTKKSLKNLYEDRERMFSDMEKSIGKKLSDTTKNFIINEVIINNFTKKKLIGKTHIVIDDVKSSLFGLKVPVMNGEIDKDFINMEFDLLGQKSREKIIEEAGKFADSRTRLVKQLIKYENNTMFDFNDTENEIRVLLLDKIGIALDEEIIGIITDTVQLENVLNKSSAEYTFNGANYEFKSRLDVAVIKMLAPFIEKNDDDRKKLASYINKNSVIIASQYIYDHDFEELYGKISENPNFKIEKKDLYILRQNKSRIGKMLRQGIPVTDIVDGYNFNDRNNMIFVLSVFKENLNSSIHYEEDFNPVFRDSFFEDTPDLRILNDQSNYTRNSAEKFSEMIKENQEKLNSLNISNQEILDKNFDNVMNRRNKINLINEIENTKVDIENLKFFAQNPENITKSSFLKKKFLSMHNKLTSTIAVDTMLRSRVLSEKYRDVLKLTDRFYIEIFKDMLKEKWQVLLRDYYTDAELLKNEIAINESLNRKLIREMEYNLALYTRAGVEEKIRILNHIMSNIDIKKLNREFLNKERRKALMYAKSLLKGDRTELTENNRKMHELLNRNTEKLERMDDETKKSVNRFADRFMKRLEGDSEDKDFSGKFSVNAFYDREFIDYITKYENVDNSYIREILALDDEGTFAEVGYQNQSFQELSVNDRLARYREQIKVSTLRKTNLTGKKIFENPEIKKFKDRNKKLEEEISDVKSKVKEIFDEAEREHEEDMKKISKERKESLENQEKTKEKLKEDVKITVAQVVESKKEEERAEAEREDEEDKERFREEKEKSQYVRVPGDFVR